MRQELTTDVVERYIEAAPGTLYDIIADVTRTPELTDDVVSCTWLGGATSATVGTRFKTVNRPRGRGPKWTNKPVVIAADRGREFAFARTEPFAGTLEWRYLFATEGTGTRVIESYTVTRPVTIVGWFIIDTLYGAKDQRGHLRASMTETLDRLAALVRQPVR